MGKLQEFSNLILNYDMNCIQETWLNESYKVYFKNYSCFRNDRTPLHGGGTLIVCRDHLDPIYYPNSSNNFKRCEFTLVSIKVPNSDSEYCSHLFINHWKLNLFFRIGMTCSKFYLYG